MTFHRQLYVIRLVNPEPQILLLVILEGDRVDLAMARREIRAPSAHPPGDYPRVSRAVGIADPRQAWFGAS